MLLLVDGSRNIDEVLRLGQQAGVSRAYLDELLALGLVVLAAPMKAAVQIHDPDEPLRSGFGPETGFGPMSPAGGDTRDTPSDVHALDTIGLGPAVSDHQLAGFDPADLAFAEARSVLTQALLAGAPISGAVTLLRVRRARNRAALRVLLPEVQARLSSPQHLSQARQIVSRIERLLAS
ncbi:MAG: hypothetical protein AB9M60_06610 [Leptothrix sp. (in: b-proteobacteria)]